VRVRSRKKIFISSAAMSKSVNMAKAALNHLTDSLIATNKWLDVFSALHLNQDLSENEHSLSATVANPKKSKKTASSVREKTLETIIADVVEKVQDGKCDDDQVRSLNPRNDFYGTAHDVDIHT